MKRSYLSTVVMVVVFGGLIAWYLVYEKKVRPQQHDAEEKAKQLVALKQDDVQELSIERTNTPTIKLKKTGTDWSISEPVQDQADSSTVNSLVSAVTTTKYERIVDEKPKDLDEYGLKTPLVKISLKKSDATPAETVMIGRDTPVGASVYARSGANETVYKVPSSIKSGADRTLKDLRNKSVITGISRPEITEVEVQGAAGSVVLRRGENDSWMLSRQGLPADTNEVNKLLNAVADLKAADFAAEGDSNLKTFGLNPPKVKVFLTKGKDKDKLTRVGVWFGVTKDKVYTKREDGKVVYVVEKGTIEKIDRPEAAYRNMELAIFNRFDVKKIKIEHGKDTLELAKEATGWTFPADAKTKVDTAKVDALLAKLQDTKIAKYAPTKSDAKSAKFGLGEPKLVLRVFDVANNAEREKVVLSFGAHEGPLVYTSRSGLDLPFLIKDEDFKKLNLSKTDLVKADEKKPSDKPETNKAVDKKG